MTTRSATPPAEPETSCSPFQDQLSFSSIISALSFAIDLTEGAVPGHALRTCALGMHIAREMRLPGEELQAIYHALLLKDIGCSSNAARMCQIVGGGDDRAMKNGAKLEDWTKPHKPSLAALRLLWQQVLPGAGPLRRILRILRIGFTQHSNNREMIALRCDRGAQIAGKLGLSRATSNAIHGLDEHWDGSGYPDRLRGREIPVLARLVAVAQHLDAFASERDRTIAMAVLRERRGTWFDPAIVDVVERLEAARQLWPACFDVDVTETRAYVLGLAPAQAGDLATSQIDRICEAFADVVDAKSPFTFRHSMGVAMAATAICHAMRLEPDRTTLVRRSALLHDLGKLAVPNSILDKPGKLNAEEWAAVKEHPRLTREILERVEPFREMAVIAGAHHEKLDGSGYPEGLTADQLPLEARIIAVADCYAALTEERPYREALTHETTLGILMKLAPHALDLSCLEALETAMQMGLLGHVSTDAQRAAAAKLEEAAKGDSEHSGREPGREPAGAPLSAIFA